MKKSGEIIKIKRTYEGSLPNAWLDAVKLLAEECRARVRNEIAALAISSQVGTYVINGREVIPWSSDVGIEELKSIKSVIKKDEFISEIGMDHPELISYPLPRMVYIQKHFGEKSEVLMPKELLIRDLTGETVTDVFSMRGIANAQRGEYADKIIDKLGIKIALPKLKRPDEVAGYITEDASRKYGLPSGIPVYLGCNDFFAGLLGMGIYEMGDFFELSGTSSHIGYISENINRDAFVSGEYFIGNATYGGTKSSGVSCDFAINNFGIDNLSIESALSKKTPIFLPYLAGERAPIFDENARGVYFGLNSETDKESLAYATLEGVIFSLYDIAESMGAPKPNRFVCGGGSARNTFMNKLRATLFDCEVISVCENDTSALGACLIAMVGNGVFKNFSSAVKACVKYNAGVYPIPEYKDILKKRFSIYKELYSDLKHRFKKFNNI